MNQDQWLEEASDVLISVLRDEMKVDAVAMLAAEGTTSNSASEVEMEDLRPRAMQEARWLLQQVRRIDATRLWLTRDQVLSETDLLALSEGLEQRKSGVPLAYILGEWSFYGLELRVTPDTLIPRADTELMVDTILNVFDDPEKPFSLLDLGTGSGAIALAVAHHRPKARVMGRDCCPRALSVARENAQRLGLERVQWSCGDWFSGLDAESRFDAVISNPPYLAADDSHLVGGIRYEPRDALVSGVTGMEALHTIIQGAGAFLQSGGLLALEHGFCQADDVLNAMRSAGFQDIRTQQDLAQRDRLTWGRLP